MKILNLCSIDLQNAFCARHHDKQPNSVQALNSNMAEIAKSIIPTLQATLPAIGTPGLSIVSFDKVTNLRASYLQQLKDLHI